MPTSTYFRLPEEKRQRLMDACWTEFSQNRFADISINKIIAAAQISRGSFYQYFTDKEDLIQYLIGDIREYFISRLREILLAAGGDLLAYPLGAFDRFVQKEGDTDPMLARFIQVLKLNQGFDTQTLFSETPGFLPDPLWEVVDTSKLRQQDRAFAEHVFHLTCAVLAFSIVAILRDPTQRQVQRQVIKARTEMLRSGCAAPAAPTIRSEATI